MNVLDPITYYLEEERTSVAWPEAVVPVGLTLPDVLEEEPVFSLREWFERGLGCNYGGPLFSSLLSHHSVAWLWEETEKIFPLSPRLCHGLQYIYNVAESGFSSNLGECCFIIFGFGLKLCVCSSH